MAALTAIFFIGEILVVTEKNPRQSQNLLFIFEITIRFFIHENYGLLMDINIESKF